MFQCTHSDEIYEITYFDQHSFFSNTCPNDPYFYQVCGAGHEEVITNSGGILCGYYICTWGSSHVSSESYDIGTKVTMTPDQNQDSFFINWGGDCANGTGRDLSWTVTMNSNVSCTVVFDLQQ